MQLKSYLRYSYNMGIHSSRQVTMKALLVTMRSLQVTIAPSISSLSNFSIYFSCDFNNCQCILNFLYSVHSIFITFMHISDNVLIISSVKVWQDMELVKVSYMYLHLGSFDKHKTTSGRGGKDQLRIQQGDFFTTSWLIDDPQTECQFIHVPTRTANYHRTQLAFIIATQLL